jgi:hypothetical protein
MPKDRVIFRCVQPTVYVLEMKDSAMNPVSLRELLHTLQKLKE